MVQLNRRKLLTGLLAGTAGTAIATHLPAQAVDNPSSTNLPEESTELFDYDGDLGQVLPLAETPIQPTIAYNRQISGLLIQCAQIGIEQYEAGVRNPQYQGAINILKSYTSDLDRYTQVAAFTVEESLAQFLGQNRRLRAIVEQFKNPRTVYIGFALTSPENNIIVLRGTITPSEWLGNFQTRQVEYRQSRMQHGRVHQGFFRLYERLNSQIQQVARTFSTTVPCYVTGHSLGGALATLTAINLASNFSELRNQIQLYSYASPRVGDSTFAKFYTEQVPNSYRVLNLTDIVPQVPPSTIKNLEFQHIGQPWSFLSYTGNIVPSHSTIAYQLAIQKQLETLQ